MKRAVTVLLLVASTAWAAPAGLQSTTFGHGPTIVMVHNLGGGRMSWMPTARKLMSSYRIVLVDLPGHGGSPISDPFTIQSGAAALDEVLATQKAESTVIVGQGMGAVMAMAALHAHPERARGLVAIEMSLKKPFNIPDQQREAFFSMIDKDYDTFIKNTYTALTGDSAQRVALHVMAAQVPAPVMKSYLRDMMSFDPTEKAKNVKTPLLLLITDRIWSVDRDSTAIVNLQGYDALPASKFALRHIRDCGILVATEQPDSLAAQIGAFSRQVLATKASASK